MTVRKVSGMQTYMDDEDIATMESENEDEYSPRSSSIQSGWEASANIFAPQTSTEKKSFGGIREFKFLEEPQVVKFLDADPIPYFSHWVNGRSTGRKSFICIDPDGSKGNCPLCKVYMRENKYIANKTLTRRSVERKAKVAFNVVIWDEEGAKVVFLETGQRLFQQLSRLHADPKNGPLPKIFWALSRTGTKLDTVHHVTPVKPRDLAEDWDMDPEELLESMVGLKPFGYKDMRHSTIEELQAVVEEIDA